MTDELVCKVVLLGSHGVGKSAIATALALHGPLSAAFTADDAAGPSPLEVPPTIGVDVFSFVESSNAVSAVGEVAVRAQLWDVAGQAIYAPPDLPHVLRGASVVLWCYDPTAETTLQELLDRYIPLSLEHAANSSWLLLQTKKDTIAAKKPKKVVALGIRHRDAAANVEDDSPPAFDAVRQVEQCLESWGKKNRRNLAADAIPFLSLSVLEAQTVTECRSRIVSLALQSWAAAAPPSLPNDEELGAPRKDPSTPELEIKEEVDNPPEEVEVEPESEEEPQPPPVVETKMGVNRLQQLQEAAQRQRAADVPPPAEAEANESDEEKEEDEDESEAEQEEAVEAAPAVHPRLAAAMQRLQHHERVLEQKREARTKRKSTPLSNDSYSEDEEAERKGTDPSSGKSKDKKKKKGPNDKACGCCVVM